MLKAQEVAAKSDSIEVGVRVVLCQLLSGGGLGGACDWEGKEGYGED